MNSPLKIVMLGASGAVGGHALKVLLGQPTVAHITSLGRRTLDHQSRTAGLVLDQRVVDVLDPASYRAFLGGHDTALCALGVGQPSKMSREEFLRVDRDAVLAFGKACRDAGIRHFSLLCAVGADSKSAFFYPRTKGQLEDGLAALGFERLSFFEPSMILTPKNRYGLLQGLTLALWPLVDRCLHGPLRRFRGVRVEDLGRAMALDALRREPGLRRLTWDDFQDLNR
jgi:uncharacterized protein YbjT (DUF2867 family)